MRKHLALRARSARATPRQQLAQLCPAMTVRELDVCERLLTGMTQDGVAADLGLGLSSVKTYRNQLSGLLLAAAQAA